MLVHVGAAHARPAGTRGVANPARARRQSRKSRPRAGTPEWGLPQPWSAGSGPAGRRAGQSGDWPPVPQLALVPTVDPGGPCGTRPGGASPSQLEAAAGLTRSSGPMAADAGHTHGRCPRTPPVHCALPWQRPTLGGPAQSRPYTEERVPRVGQCECKRHDRSDPWQIGWTARPDATSRTDAVVALTREGTPCPSRHRDDATRTLRCDAADRAAALRHTLHCGHAGCAALQPLLQVATECGLLKRTAPRCDRVRCVATDCHALQQTGMRCNRLCTLYCDRAVRAELQPLQQVAAGACLLQRAVPCCNR